MSKAIDKMAGAEREIVGKSPRHVSGKPNQRTEGLNGSSTFAETVGMGQHITAPATDEAKQWEGWGTALKPAYEPWVVARKPLSESSVARQVLANGCGALNIDQSRVGTTRERTEYGLSSAKRSQGSVYGAPTASADFNANQGRWPSNLLLSHHPDCEATGGVRRVKGNDRPNLAGAEGDGKGGYHGLGPLKKSTVQHANPDGTEEVAEWICVDCCPIRLLDEQSGQSKSNQRKINNVANGTGNAYYFQVKDHGTEHTDQGGASRFFQQFDSEPGFLDCEDTDGVLLSHQGFKYQSKSSRRERNAGLEGMPEGPAPESGRTRTNPAPGRTSTIGAPRANHHPTVKPIALMRYLCKLITPPGGTVLDPFCGSGSTGCAAIQEGFNFIGIEKESEYAEIARRRIAHWSQPEEARAKENGKAPAKKRTTYGFKTTDVERRCPEHGEPIPSGSTTYKCGCQKVWYKTGAGVCTEREPTEPMDTLF